MLPCELLFGEIETHVTGRACRIITDIIKYHITIFCIIITAFDKYMGYVFSGGLGLPFVVNKGRTFKTFEKYFFSG